MVRSKSKAEAGWCDDATDLVFVPFCMNSNDLRKAIKAGDQVAVIKMLKTRT